MPSAAQVLAKLKHRGHHVETVIDVGASNGQWSESARPVFPDARYLLIEANPHHRPALEHYVRHRPRAQFVLAGASDHEGNAFFYATADPEGGTVRNDQPSSEWRATASVTIDAEVARRALPPPYLLKLDTHGLEAAILRGAAETLRQTSIVILETYIFPISSEAMQFDEMCRQMDALGFRCIEMFDPLWRSYDGSLWQIDMAFVRRDAREFSHLGF